MLSTKTRLLAALALVAFIPTAQIGCGGNECASGTIEKDGQCVPEAVCGDGTVATDGKCIVDTAGCGEGTVEQGGQCIPAPASCGEGATFDNGSGKCIPNTALTCGDGTTAQGNVCIPSDKACGAGTQYMNDKCVVADAACGAKTQLDANTGTCVITDAVCGANTAFSGGKCAPVDTVCATGTIFNQGMGVCLPEATCRAGDVVLNGQCVRPIEETAANADINESENNDPSLGGIANAVDLSGKMAGDVVTIAGVINAPRDLDNNMTLDQDVDQFEFDASAGQMFRITVQTVEDTLPVSFRVIGSGTETAGYERDAAHGVRQGASRQIVATKTGKYSIRVAPALAFAGSADPVGGADNRYVVSIEILPEPTAKDFDTTAGMSASGSLYTVNENLYKITNLTAGEKIDIKVNSLGHNAEKAVMMVWSDPQTLVETIDLDAETSNTVTLPAMGGYVLFDWLKASGPSVGYDVSITERVLNEDLGTLAAGSTTTTTPKTLFGDETFTHNVTISAGEVLQITGANDADTDIELRVTDPVSGDSIFSNTSFDVIDSPTGEEVAYIFAGDTDRTVAINVTNMSATQLLENHTLTLLSITPQDLGTQGVGDTVSISDMAQLNDMYRKFFKVTFDANVLVNGSYSATVGDPEIEVYAYTGANSLFRDLGSSNSVSDQVMLQGAHLIAIEADGDLTSGFSGSFTLSEAPIPEVEPNNDSMTATPITDITKDYFGTANASTMGDADWFSFTPTVTDVYTFTAISGNSSARVRIVNSMSEDVDKATFNPLSVGQVMYAGQTYYIVVDGDSSSSTSDFVYTLNVQKEDKTPATFGVEPNESFAASTPLNYLLPFSVQGTVDSSTDQDWFSITRNVAGPVRILLEDVEGQESLSSDVTLEVYDTDGSTQLMVGPRGDVTLNAGTSYIKVSGFDATTSSPGNTYQIDVSPAPTQEVEPNDTSGTATVALDPTKLHAGVTNGNGSDDDYWSFVVTTPAIYTVTGAAFGTGNYCATWTVTDTAGSVLASSTNSTINSDALLFPGTYYLLVSGNCASSYTLNYEFSMTSRPAGYDYIEDETAAPNNTSATANDLRATNTLPIEIIGEVSSLIDEDWYRVSLPAGSFVMSLGAQPGQSAPSSAMTMELYDNTGMNLVGSGSVTVAAGDYYIKVSGLNPSDEGKYVASVFELTYAKSPMPAPVITNSATVTDTLVVPGTDTCIISNISLYTDISHTWRSDIELTLTSPTGTAIKVIDNTGGSADDFVGFWPGTFAPSNDLTPFVGQALAGTWTVTIDDSYSGDDGTLNTWGLSVSCQ